MPNDTTALTDLKQSFRVPRERAPVLAPWLGLLTTSVRTGLAVHMLGTRYGADGLC